MDKDKFIEWLSQKSVQIVKDTPVDLLCDKESVAFIQGAVTTFEEIKMQVESGKFDK